MKRFVPLALWMVTLSVSAGAVSAQGLGLALCPVGKDTLAATPAVQAKTKRHVYASPEYLRWLEERSMLYQARQLASKVSGVGVHWRRPYAEPQPVEVVKRASVWVLGYPGSVVTEPRDSVIATWADPKLWQVFRTIGIDLLHTGPVKRSGGIRRKEYTPTIDGWFDRITLEIDPGLGTEAEYVRMVETAKKQGGMIAGDLVPLHTGTGADFRLAQRKYKDYAGMYTMVEIQKKHWHLLPPIGDEWSSKPVPIDTADKLTKLGYIPGRIHSCDASPDAHKLSGWDATGQVMGADGKLRRWVFLHYFMPGQPTLNWIDPTSTAQTAIAGDIVKTVHVLGARVIRLDAVPFMGIERKPGFALSWHYQHPLSVMGTDYLAFLTRKMGGWSFQELNVPLPQLKAFLRQGPDLSYNFFTRTECMHSLLTGDATVLRYAYRRLKKAGIPLVRLVHDLQNHDEITYQLVELDFRGDDTFLVGGEKILGRVWRERILNEMRQKAAGKSAPYNLLYRPTKDGVATTFAGFVAASLGICDLKDVPKRIDDIRQGHLLLAMSNAMQPGVFSLSGWDLVGALPLPAKAVQQRLGNGDYRWINRGGIDLIGLDVTKKRKSKYGLPRAHALYGSLPEQLKRPDSFASQLKEMLAARKKYGIATGRLTAVPHVNNSGVCALVMKLPLPNSYAVNIVNFGRNKVIESLELPKIGAGKKLRDEEVVCAYTLGKGDVNVTASALRIELGAWSGMTLVVRGRM